MIKNHCQLVLIRQKSVVPATLIYYLEFSVDLPFELNLSISGRMGRVTTYPQVLLRGSKHLLSVYRVSGSAFYIEKSLNNNVFCNVAWKPRLHGGASGKLPLYYFPLITSVFCGKFLFCFFCRTSCSLSITKKRNRLTFGNYLEKPSKVSNGLLFVIRYTVYYAKLICDDVILIQIFYT